MQIWPRIAIWRRPWWPPFSPGANTVILRGKNDGAGVGLVEAYDPIQNSPTSARGFVQIGDDVMIGDFIVGGGGGGNSTIVARAIGPSLEGFGIAEALQDPTLELRFHRPLGQEITLRDFLHPARASAADRVSSARG